MKKYINTKTIFLIISVLIIIAGAIAIGLKGFEKGVEYKAGTRIEVYIPSLYEKQEVLDMAKQSFETDDILFIEIEKTKQVAGIKIVDYTKEQLDNYINKITEKYNIEEDELEYHEILVPETKISTIIKPYILPILFSTCLILIYIIIKDIKSNNGTKMPLKVLRILVISLGIYFSIIALFRLQFTIYTMPIALAIYMVALVVSTNKKCE